MEASFHVGHLPHESAALTVELQGHVDF